MSRAIFLRLFAGVFLAHSRRQAVQFLLVSRVFSFPTDFAFVCVCCVVFFFLLKNYADDYYLLFPWLDTRHWRITNRPFHYLPKVNNRLHFPVDRKACRRSRVCLIVRDTRLLFSSFLLSFLPSDVI